MFIIQAIRRDFNAISTNKNSIESLNAFAIKDGDVYLCKGNGCYGDKSTKPFYSFYHFGNTSKLVYFKYSWQAYMYIARYGEDDSIYIVRYKDVDCKEKDIEIFDPAVWEFIPPDEYYVGKSMYMTEVNSLISDADNVIIKYEMFQSYIDDLVNQLIKKYHERPTLFAKLWKLGGWSSSRKISDKGIFEKINKLVYGEKECQKNQD